MTSITDLGDNAPDIIEVDTEEQVEVVEMDTPSAPEVIEIEGGGFGIMSSLLQMYQPYFCVTGGKPDDVFNESLKLDGGSPDSVFSVGLNFKNAIGG